MVRRRLPDGKFSDAVGVLLEADDGHVAVATRRGLVRIEAAEIAIGRVVAEPRSGGGTTGVTG